MRKLLIGAVLLLVMVGALSHWRHRPLHPLPGVLAADVPEQVDLDPGTQLQRGDVTLTTRAHFDITARVLSRKDYSWSADADLVPEDLALGWGRMSDTDILAKIDITQSGRFYYWHVNEFPIPRREIETSSANMHMIPADAGVKRELEQVRQGQVVHIEGFLVDASRRDGWHWNTSMTRDDTGAGACELIYVESIGVVAP
ncbi:hypothetical protein EAH75_10385 [Rhodanobacter glycinis]|uniref:Uncharacterized protein n=1 Tax=Rhodanobacter glycinis TaxID=582702 RepID=A0A502CDT9_9GAMM|nr:hypothetical protein [Rhodanobacter glycinis]TPG11327.1 hypothetical protein EAH88_01940 [Rhodanobacter glycinis]TPG48818.1 hypothetical protein EAH75_10385 [Rhodanobacter glycinis]